MLKSISFLLYVEFLLLWRRSQEWLYPLVFFMMLIVLLPLALTTDPTLLKQFFPGYMWIAALLASMLSIQQIFFSEIEEGHLEQLFF